MNEMKPNPDLIGYYGYVYKHKSMTWSAVIAGALIAFGLTFLFNILLVGVGLVVYSNTSQGAPELAFYGFLVTLIGGTILLFFAGYKTGKLIKHCPRHYATTEVTGNVTDKGIIDCGCYHGMTHGFLAWVLYLIISLAFFSVIAHDKSYDFMRSPYLITERNAPDTQAAATANPTTNQAVSTTETQTTAPDPRAVHVAGVHIIAVFLIFLFGAVGCAIGSFIGMLANRKYYAHHVKI